MKATNSPLKNKKSRAPKQLELKSYSHGGVREGSGRKKLKKGRRQVAHSKRERVESKHPFHLTVRFKGPNVALRNKHNFRIFRRAVKLAKKFGLRVIHFVLLGNHYHLLAEADSNTAVTQGMRSINVSLAKIIGVRVENRFHIEINKTPTQVRATLAYIFTNAAKHFKRTKVFDYFSSYALFDYGDLLSRLRRDLDWSKPILTIDVLANYLEPLSTPMSWLARVGWAKAR
jgi:REP element-mobilizing transposase RayT